MISVRARASSVVLALLAASAACGGDARRAGPSDRDEVRVRIGTVGDMPVASLGEMMSAEPLVAVAWDGRPSYRLAESATQSPDGVITLTLRPDARFHTGDLVTADVVRDLLRAQLEETADVKSVESDGARTIIVRLQPGSTFKLVDLTEFDIADVSNPLLRTGPFRLTALKPEAILEPFEAYYQGAPAVSRIEIKPYGTQRAAWTAMMRGEINFLHEVSRDAIDFIEAGGNIRAYPLLRGYYFPLVFNMKHPVLRRKDVRVALNEAIDRDEIVNNAMRGYALAAEGPFWPYHWAYPPGRVPSTYNPEAARVRLDSVGLPVPRGKVQTMPSRFEFTCLLHEGDARFERIALIVQRQLFAIGVDMRIRTLPRAKFFGALAAGTYDAFMFEMTSGRTLNWVYSFWRSPGRPDLFSTGYSGADEALDRMRSARTDEETRIAVADVMHVLRDDPPALFLVWPRDARAVEKSIHVPYEPNRDILGTLWQWRQAPSSSAASRRR